MALKGVRAIKKKKWIISFCSLFPVLQGCATEYQDIMDEIGPTISRLVELGYSNSFQNGLLDILVRVYVCLRPVFVPAAILSFCTGLLLRILFRKNKAVSRVAGIVLQLVIPIGLIVIVYAIALYLNQFVA